MEDGPVLRKSDLSFIWSGTAARVVVTVAVLSMLYGAFTDPEFREPRPGIVDGIVGAALGVLVIRLLVGRLAAAWERQFARMHGDRFWLVRPQFDLTLPAAFFGSVIVSSGAGWVLRHILGLRWPLCGEMPGFFSGFLGFAVAYFFSYAAWYDRLPD